MMNVLEQEDIIKGLPDQALMQEAQMPSGQVPQYLVVSEIQRRSDMRKRYKADQGQMPQGTVKDKVVQEGIMASMPPQMSPQMAMAPQMPQRMPQMSPPQMPPTQMMSEGGEATLLDRYYNLGTDDPRGKGFELGADDDPSANRRGILQGLSLLGVDQEAIDNATRRTAEPPRGLLDLIEKAIYAGKKRGLIGERTLPGIKLSEDDLEDLEASRAFTEAGLPAIKKANGGYLDMVTIGTPDKEGRPVREQLDALIDSGQMGYADILSFLDGLNISNENRMEAMDYVKGRTGTLDRVGYDFGQSLDRLGDRLGSTFNRLTGRTDAERGQDQQFMENLQAGSLMRLPTQEEMLQGAPEAERVGITQGMVPSPMGAGRSLIAAGGRQLVSRSPFNVPNISSAPRSGILSGAQGVSGVIESDEDISDYTPPSFSERFGYNPDFLGVDESGTLLPPDLRAIKAETELDQRKPPVTETEPPAVADDPVPPGGGIEKKGGGEEVQGTSADRMAELLARMGRSNRGAALVALGAGIAEGKTMEGGREAANILAKGEQSATKLEMDATQFNRQMGLLEQRVENAAKSGNASVIAALVTATTRELEALDTAVGRADEATMKRVQSLRNTLSELRRIYMPTSGGADGISSFGSLVTGSPSRTKP